MFCVVVGAEGPGRRGNAIAEAVGLVPSKHGAKSPNTEAVTFQYQVLVKQVVVPSSHFNPASENYCSCSSAQNPKSRGVGAVGLSHSSYYWSEWTPMVLPGCKEGTLT